MRKSSGALRRNIKRESAKAMESQIRVKSESISLDTTQNKESQSVQGTMNLILAEVKSLKRMITHLTEEVESLKNDDRQPKTTQRGTSESSNFPVMPFNEKEAFQNFTEQLADKEPILNEFKTYIQRLDGNEVASFLRAAMKALLTDNLAQQFSWKGTKQKPALVNNAAVTIIKRICFQKFPNSDDFRVNSILQKHLIYAKDRIEKNRKRHSKENI